MENTLSQLDGKILLLALLALIAVWLLGWFFGWVFYRAKAREVLEQSRAEAQAKAANVDALKHDLNQRDRVIQERKDELSSLASDKAQLEKKVESQDADISDLTTKIEMLETSQNETENDDENAEIVSELEDTVANLRTELSSEKQRHDKRLAKIMAEKALETEALNSSKSQNISLSDEIKDHKETTHRLNSEVAAAVRELNEYKKEATEERAAGTTSTNTIHQLQDKLTQLKQIKDKNLGEISNLQSSLTIWQNKAAKADMKIAESAEKIHLLEQRVADSGKSNPSYARLLEIKEQEILEQKNHTHLAQSRLIAIRDEVVSRDKDIEQLNELLQNQQVQHRHETTLLTRKLEEQESATAETMEQYAQENQRHLQSIATLTKDHATLSQKLSQAHLSIDELKQHNKSLLTDFNSAQESLKINESEIAKLDSTNAELEKSVASFKLDIEYAQRKLHKVDADFRANVSVNEKLQTELKNQMLANQALENTLKASLAQTSAAPADTHQAPALLTEKPTQVDDLKKIKGIGPSLETLLNQLGIYQFRQLATLTSSEVAWVDEHIESFKGRIYRDDWVGQAKQLD